jgi:hypothetical protein
VSSIAKIAALLLALLPCVAWGQVQFLAIAAGVDDEVISVTDYGATTAAGNDDTSAIQAAIDAAVEGAAVFMPAGFYTISDTLDLKRNVSLIGEGAGLDSQGTVLGQTGVGAGAMVNPETNSRAVISGIRMYGSTMHCIDTSDTQNFEINNCVLAPGAAKWAIYTEGNNFSLRLDNLRVVGRPGGTFDGYGVLLASHNFATDLDIAGQAIGVRIWGTGGALKGARIEVNTIGVEVGKNYLGASDSLSQGSIEDVTLEGNDQPFNVEFASNSTFSTIKMIGREGNTASGDAPTRGLWFGKAYYCTFNECSASFEIDGTAAYFGDVHHCIFDNCYASNDIRTGLQWTGNHCILTGNTFRSGNVLLHPSDVIDGGLVSGAIRTHSLAQVDFLAKICAASI